MKIATKDCDSKQIRNIENYLTKKKNKKKVYGRTRYQNKLKSIPKNKVYQKNYCKVKKN